MLVNIVKILVVILLLCKFNFALTQNNVYMPDAALRTCIERIYPGAVVNDSVLRDSVPAIKVLAGNSIDFITDLTGLAELDSLTTLIMFGDGMDTFPTLTLEKLSVISINIPSLRQFPDFSGLPELKRLGIYISLIDTVPSLDTLSKLEYLSIGGNRIKQIGSLSGCTSLQVLWLNGNQLQQLPPLNNLQQLRKLNASNNPLKVHPDLSGNIRLDTLMLGECQLTGGNDYSANKTLRYLQLNNNQLTQFPGIITNDSIRTVVVFGNPITEIPDFPLPIALEEIVAFNCLISQVGDLGQLYALKILHLALNKLTTLPSFASNKALKVFNASYNQLTAFPDFHPDTQLDGISLSHNQLKTVPALGFYYKPKSIYLNDNLLETAPILTGLDTVKMLNLANNFIRQIPDEYAQVIKWGIDLTGNKLDFSDAAALRLLDSLIFRENPFVHIDIFFDAGLRFSNQKPFGDSMTVQGELTYDVTLSIAQQRFADSYQWYKDGVAIAGATDTALTIPFVQQQDAGEYTCRSFGSYLSDMFTGDSVSEFVSAPIYLTVEEPLIRRNPLGIFPNPGSIDELGIRYLVFEEGVEVVIDFYAIDGKRMNVYTQKQSVGEYTLNLQGFPLTAGVYIVHLKAGSTDARQRVVVTN